MAGDWFQADNSQPEKPEVQQVISLTGADVDQVLGRLWLLWRWVDWHADLDVQIEGGGILPAMSVTELCRVCHGDERFWRAVETVGWITISDRGVLIPKFTERFSESAKRRAVENKRKRMARMDIELKTPEPRQRKRRSSPPAKPESHDTLSIEEGAERSRQSVFDRVTVAMLSNPNQLVEWWAWACSRPAPIGIDDLFHRERLLAAAARANAQAGAKSPITNPVAFVCGVMGRKQWHLLEPEDMQRGRTLLAQCQHRTDVRNAHVRQAVQNVVKRPPHEQKSTLTLTEQRAALLKIQSKKQA